MSVVAISEHTIKIDAAVIKLVSNIKEVCSYKQTPDMNISTISLTYLKKMESINSILCTGAALQVLLRDKLFFNTVRKRVKDQQERDNFDFNSQNQISQYFCCNDVHVSWEMVTENLIDI